MRYSSRPIRSFPRPPARLRGCGLHLALVPGLLLTLLARPTEARPRLAPASMAKLERWGVIAFSEDKGMITGKAVGRVASPPEAVLFTFLQLGKYKHWLPSMKGSRVTRRSGRDTWGVLETKLPWPVRDAWVYVKTSYRAKRGGVYEARWKMINGTMKRYEGHALIEPWTKDGHHSVITFSISFEPKTAAPRSAIRKGAKRVAEIFVHRLRMRVKALRKYKKLPPNLKATFAQAR